MALKQNVSLQIDVGALTDENHLCKLIYVLVYTNRKNVFHGLLCIKEHVMFLNIIIRHFL